MAKTKPAKPDFKTRKEKLLALLNELEEEDIDLLSNLVSPPVKPVVTKKKRRPKVVRPTVEPIENPRQLSQEQNKKNNTAREQIIAAPTNIKLGPRINKFLTEIQKDSRFQREVKTEMKKIEEEIKKYGQRK